GPGVLPQHLAELGQQPVPRRMTEALIHRFEIVQIEKQKTERPVVPLGPVQLLDEPDFQVPAVVQPGQLIGQDQVLQAPDLVAKTGQGLLHIVQQRLEITRHRLGPLALGGAALQGPTRSRLLSFWHAHILPYCRTKTSEESPRRSEIGRASCRERVWISVVAVSSGKR